MGIRTPDLLNAIEALYQLSYDPVKTGTLILMKFYLGSSKKLS